MSRVQDSSLQHTWKILKMHKLNISQEQKAKIVFQLEIITWQLFDRLCSLSITSFEDQERRIVHANDHNERISANVDFVSAIVIILFALEQHQNQDDSAEIEKQKWEVTKILDKREIRSRTQYRVRWKSTWLSRSELENAQKLLWEYETKDRAQHERKRNRFARKDIVWWSLYITRRCRISFLSSNSVCSSLSALTRSSLHQE